MALLPYLQWVALYCPSDGLLSAIVHVLQLKSVVNNGSTPHFVPAFYPCMYLQYMPSKFNLTRSEQLTHSANPTTCEL